MVLETTLSWSGYETASLGTLAVLKTMRKISKLICQELCPRFGRYNVKHATTLNIDVVEWVLKPIHCPPLRLAGRSRFFF
jgi:hypothetical protein